MLNILQSTPLIIKDFNTPLNFNKTQINAGPNLLFKVIFYLKYENFSIFKILQKRRALKIV